MSSTGRPAVFLDRDGTICVERHYLADPDALTLLPGAARAVRALNERGIVAVVVTNQSGVARGILTEARLEEIHARLRALLAAEGAHVDAIYACPHHPTEGEPPYRADCECRKPRPGMLAAAARDLGLDLARSWIVGDAPRDVEAGRAVGVRGILVGGGESEARGGSDRGGPERRVDLAAAVEEILGRDSGPA